MVKKHVLITAVIICAIMVVGQIGRRSFRDHGLHSIRHLSELEGFEYCFERIWDDKSYEGFVEYKEDYIKESGDCDYIVIAEATGKLRFIPDQGIQEVVIRKVIEGNEDLEGKTIDLEEAPRLRVLEKAINYERIKKGISVDYSGLVNFMKPGDQYLVFINSYAAYIYSKEEEANLGKHVKFKYKSGPFGCLNLTNGNPQKILKSTEQKYTYKEVKDYEYFTYFEDDLEIWYEIKDAIIDKYITNKE